ncbi:MAG: aminoglycoside phosphotransferase family protein [Burkholderiales bacterium]
MERKQLLADWLRAQFPDDRFRLEPASADASFRRYFRATFRDRTLIVMDAPPGREDCAPFLHVAELFRSAGVNVPRVHARNLEDGLLLLDDLGSRLYLESLDEASSDRLYRDAIDSLVKIQLASRENELPKYDRALLERELRLFPDWYIAKKLDVALSPRQTETLAAMFERLLENNLVQPRVYVHRDYHSRNLMVCESNPGILDFQDAVYGPITYDLVSLFKDAYIEWPEERVLDWLIRYWERAKAAGLPVDPDFALFHRDFEWMGVQRHLKVLGIFARLYFRDGKDRYLNDMPLVMRYLRAACERYRELAPLANLFDELER